MENVYRDLYHFLSLQQIEDEVNNYQGFKEDVRPTRFIINLITIKY